MKSAKGTLAITLVVLALAITGFFSVLASPSTLGVSNSVYLPILYKYITPTPTPTLTITPTPTQTQTNAPTYTPTPTSTVIPTGVIILTNHSYYIDSVDYLHIVGEVFNNTSDYLRFVKITANIYNSSGGLVDTSISYTYLDNIPPHQKTCFDILLEKPSDWSYYLFEKPSYWDDGEALPNLIIFNDSGSYDPTYGWYEIIGEVRNESGVRVEYVSPIGTLYNASGTVLDCGLTYVNSTHLDPGQTSSFDLLFVGRDFKDVATYRLQVDGNSVK